MTLVVDTVSSIVGAFCIHVVSVLVYTSDFVFLILSKDAHLDNWSFYDYSNEDKSEHERRVCPVLISD